MFRLDRIILCLSLAYIGLLFSDPLDPAVWMFVTIAVIFAKTAHLCFYKIMDFQNLYKSQRYRERLIAEGEMKKSALWILGILSSAIFLLSCFLINELCYYIAIAAVILMIFFPLIKRYSTLPYYYLGIFESICPIGGFLAAENRYEHIALVLALSVFFWMLGQEICRAGYEISADSENKIISIPVSIGMNKAQVLSVIFYIISVSGFTTAGIMNKRGLTYWISVICFVIIFIRQQVLLKSKDIDSTKAEFFQINNFIAPVIFIGTIIDVFFGI